MKRFHFINGLLISTLTLGAAACSSSTTTPGATAGDAGTGGATGSTGGTTGSTGGATGSTGGATGSTGGTTGSTGGTTGSTGGTTGSTGGATGGTDAGDPCSVYCAESLQKCKGADKTFTTETECMTACAGYATTGHDGDASGNTLQCRMTHLGFISKPSDAATHCGHTGKVPTANCL